MRSKFVFGSLLRGSFGVRGRASRALGLALGPELGVGLGLRLNIDKLAMTEDKK